MVLLTYLHKQYSIATYEKIFEILVKEFVLCFTDNYNTVYSYSCRQHVSQFSVWAAEGVVSIYLNYMNVNL